MTDRKPRVITAETALRHSGDGIEFIEAVSHNSVGAPELLFGRFTIDAGVRAGPHTHTCDTAAYVISGRAAFEIGENLEERLEVGPGDYIYVPAGVVHTEETLGAEPVVVIFARDKAGGQTHYLSGEVPSFRSGMT